MRLEREALNATREKRPDPERLPSDLSGVWVKPGSDDVGATASCAHLVEGGGVFFKSSGPDVRHTLTMDDSQGGGQNSNEAYRKKVSPAPMSTAREAGVGPRPVSPVRRMLLPLGLVAGLGATAVAGATVYHLATTEPAPSCSKHGPITGSGSGGTGGSAVALAESLTEGVRDAASKMTGGAIKPTPPPMVAGEIAPVMGPGPGGTAIGPDPDDDTTTGVNVGPPAATNTPPVTVPPTVIKPVKPHPHPPKLGGKPAMPRRTPAKTSML